MSDDDRIAAAQQRLDERWRWVRPRRRPKRAPPRRFKCECVICHRKFKSTQPRKKTCSPRCLKEKDRARQLQWRQANAEKNRQQQRGRSKRWREQQQRLRKVQRDNFEERMMQAEEIDPVQTDTGQSAVLHVRVHPNVLDALRELGRRQGLRPSTLARSLLMRAIAEEQKTWK